MQWQNVFRQQCGLQIPRRKEGYDERHMRHYTDRVGMGPDYVGSGAWEVLAEEVKLQCESRQRIGVC